MRRIDAERYLDYPNPGYAEALKEAAIADMQFENYNFVHPAWLAWTKCPLFKWLTVRKRERDLALATRQSMEYARHFGLMLIEHKDRFEFRKSAIVRRI